ncbi:MAG TPA: hypothetical protein VIQ52_03860 [Arthrobacter sp.]
MVRALLLTLFGFVALTSMAGGTVLAASAWLGSDRLGIPPELAVPSDLLQGSPFTSYLIPGLLLALIVGGLHLAAFILLLKRRRMAPPAGAAAAYSILVWIFIQMVFIPFSVLQAVYFVAGLAEVGLLLLLLGLFAPAAGRMQVDTATPRTSRDVRP